MDAWMARWSEGWTACKRAASKCDWLHIRMAELIRGWMDDEWLVERLYELMADYMTVWMAKWIDG